MKITLSAKELENIVAAWETNRYDAGVASVKIVKRRDSNYVIIDYTNLKDSEPLCNDVCAEDSEPLCNDVCAEDSEPLCNDVYNDVWQKMQKKHKLN